ILADRLIGFDHRHQTVYLVCLERPTAAARAAAWFDQIEHQLAQLPPPPPLQPSSGPGPLPLHLSRSRSTYLADIQRCLEYIRAGESYELC
ncbi:hypothetical protein, partial [Haemophilus parainfluenzae]|uniref:hypothetical protein n=1 Tax=Haemophilus parainfluenzae TaxID=729 RepID=UPI001CEDC687